MKLQLVSDMHCEMRKDGGAEAIAQIPALADTIVLAGDMFSIREEATALAVLGRFRDRWANVLYVPGNHEFWGTGGPEAIDRACALTEECGVELLERGNAPTIDGQRFVGCTLWFPEIVRGPYGRARYPDLQYIEPRGWIAAENDADVRYLTDTVASSDVVVTHHLPHLGSIHPGYAGEPSNEIFLCDLSKLIRERRPKLWLHGHTHEVFDYHDGATRIVANPVGYPGEEKLGPTQYDPGLVIEI